MLNKNAWVNRFMDLEENNQLAVAEAIIEELEINEDSFDEEDGYNFDKSARVRKLFEEWVAKSSNALELKNTKKILNSFKELPADKKNKVVEEILAVIKKYDDEVEQEKNEQICKENGHNFGKWEGMSWTTREVYWDAGPQGTIEVENFKWSRKCKRCGFVEETKQEPQSLVEERQRNEKQKRIKQLKKELKELESQE